MKRLTAFFVMCALIAAMCVMPASAGDADMFHLEDHLEWNGYAWTAINDNQPYFTDDDMTTQAYESYAELDDLGRCGAAMACLGPETLPTEKRGEIGMVKPTGWHTVKYPDRIKDNYLYNRCHLIAYELSGENANEKNLVTGTRYMNATGMLNFENQTTYFIKDTGYHVMYRSTPMFYNDELVCRGILIEAKSVEDNGQGLCLCIWCPNVQPKIGIDYATGDSWPDDTVVENETAVTIADMQVSTEEQNKQKVVDQYTYAINIKSNIFHRLDCKSVSDMSPANRQYTDIDRDSLIAQGFKPCGNCKP